MGDRQRALTLDLRSSRGIHDSGDEGTTVTNSEGEKVVVPKKADFGTVSSGGLY